MLMRFDPFRELDRLSSQVWGTAGPYAQSSVMPMDAFRDGERFVVQFDLPGVEPDSVDLTVEKNVLTVHAERKRQFPEGTEVVVAERPEGTFTRQVFLGESLDTERIEAQYDNGVLTLVVPVAEDAKPRKVAIANGHGSAKAIEARSTDA